MLASVGWWWWDRPLSADEHPTLRVATWNLRHFGDDRDDTGAVADFIRQREFDVVALQEVRGEGSAVEEVCRRLGRSWRAIVSDKTGGHRLATLYDRRVVRPGRSVRLFELPVERQPQAVHLRAGNVDFTLVNVHLFASDTRRRRAEARRLAAMLRQDRWPPGERDIVIAGDFNSNSVSGPTLSAFAGWTPTTSAGTNSDGTRPLDHVLVPPSVRVVASGVERPPRGITDHAAVWADLDVR